MELIQRGSKNNGPGHGELLAGFSPPGERDHRCALCGHRSSWNGLGPLGTPWDRADPARSRYAWYIRLTRPRQVRLHQQGLNNHFYEHHISSYDLDIS